MSERPRGIRFNISSYSSIGIGIGIGIGTVTKQYRHRQFCRYDDKEHDFQDMFVAPYKNYYIYQYFKIISFPLQTGINPALYMDINSLRRAE